MEKRVIRFFVREVYGNPLRYPADFVVELQRLTGRVTLTDGDMIALRGMGFEFQEVLPSSVMVNAGGD